MQGLTPKQQSFVEAVLSGSSLVGAYRTSYSTGTMSDRDVATEASRLSRHPKIAPILDGARAEAARRLDVTAETLTGKLLAAYDGAMAAGQYSAAVRATDSLARLHGLVPDKNEAKAPQLPQDTRTLLAEIQTLVAELGLPTSLAASAAGQTH